MDGVDATKWHLLRSCPLTPSCQGQGSQFAFTGGQRPWWSLVSSGLSVAASLPRCLGLSPLGQQGSEVGEEWVRRRRWVPWSRSTCGPDWGGGEGGGVGKRRETAAGSEYFAADTVHGTMHGGQYMEMQGCCGRGCGRGCGSWVGTIIRSLFQHCTLQIRTLLLALIQSLQPQLRRGQHEAGDGSTLSWPESFQAH